MSSKIETEHTAADRRNADPASVYILSPDDEELRVKDINQKVDAIVENRNEIIIHNIEYILQREKISQSYMCEHILEGTPLPPQMATYKKRDRDIPFRTIVRLAAGFGYTPEQLMGQLLDQADIHSQISGPRADRPDTEYGKYLGTYHIAYFGTDARLGSNRRTTTRALSFGLISVFHDDTTDDAAALHAIAFFNAGEAELKSLESAVRNAEACSSQSIRACYEKAADQVIEDKPRTKCLYEGALLLTERIAELDLHQVKGSDIVHIQLHNRAANSSDGSMYRGGLATMMSTSRGEEHMPCIQSAILSKRGFASIAREELADKLFLDPPSVDLHEETKDIVTYMKALFPSEDADTPLAHLSEADRLYTLESYIEKKLTEVIRRNVLGYFKISAAMDSDIYKIMCR